MRPPLIAARGRHARSTAWATSRCARCAASTLDVERGRVRRDHGRVGLGQVDADEHPRLPRPARPRAATCSTGDEVAALDRDELARDPQPDRSASCSRASTCSPRTSALENVELPLLYAGVAARERRRARARGARARRPRRPASTTTRTSSRAASSSASPSRARSSTEPALILADEPTGNLDSRTSVEVMALFQELEARGHHDRARHARAGHRGLRGARDRRCATARMPSDERRRATARPLRPQSRRRRHEPRSRPSASPSARCCATRLRSFLTTLGIVIGVGAVIAMVAIGEGAKAPGRGQPSPRWARTCSSSCRARPRAGGARGGFGSMPTLTWDDLQAIQTEVPAPCATPRRSCARSGAGRSARTQNWTTAITGTSPDYFDIRNWAVRQRRAVHAGATSRRANKVVVLGQTVVDKLFGAGADPVGPDGAHQEHPVPRWSACSRSKGQSPMGQDYDDVAFVPVHDVPGEDPGRAAEVHRGRHLRQRRSRPRRHRARRSRSPTLLRDRHRLAAGRGRRLLDPQPGRDGERAAGGHADARPRCSRASPRCRCSSAASAS